MDEIFDPKFQERLKSILRNDSMVSFSELKIGDVFQTDNGMFIKVSFYDPDYEARRIDAICMTDYRGNEAGEPWEVEDNEIVQRFGRWRME